MNTRSLLTKRRLMIALALVEATILACDLYLMMTKEDDRLW